MSFLTAEWRKLAIANYAIDPLVLKPYIPNKTELDFWDNTCYVSLVGFMFVNTKLVGIPIPFHRNFEEVNLRFYVKHKARGKWKRGVVFIKEIVPKAALTFVANTVYKEHYETMKMKHSWSQTETAQTVEYCWEKNNRYNRFYLQAQPESCTISPGSEAEFITEHYWGYTKINNQKTAEYEVKHPTWECYPVTDYEINVDFASVYGATFLELTDIRPKSVMLAEGSKISVENKKIL